MFFFLLSVVILAASAQESCPDLEIVESSLDDRFDDKFSYIAFIEKRDEFLDIDSICYTLEPAPLDNQTYIVYGSVVRSSGKNEVRTFIATQLVPGKIRSASPSGTETQFTLANLDCGASLAYLCTELGDTKSYVFGLTNKHEQVPDSCIQQAEEVLSGLDLTEAGVFALPMKLPSKCVVRQPAPADPQGPPKPPHQGPPQPPSHGPPQDPSRSRSGHIE